MKTLDLPAALAMVKKQGLRQPHGWRIAAGCALALTAGGVFGLTGAIPSMAGDSARLIIAAAEQPYPADLSGLNRGQGVQPIVPPANPPVTPSLDPVETAALYYYAKERQTDRVEAEILRLQALHPGFVPPQDLYLAADRIAPDETNLWQMFEAEDFTGIDAEIIRRKTADPAWAPTLDFQSKLTRKKNRIRMKELAADKDWIGLLEVSASIDPATEEDVDLVWMRIDALSSTGDKDGLARALRGLLMRPDGARLPDEHLVVSLQKALRDFPAEEIRTVAAVLWPEGSGTSLPAALRLDLVRKGIAEFNAEKDAAPVAPEALAMLSAEARKTRRPEDVSLLGWHELKRDNPKEAEDWFTIAMEVAPDPENAKGMYLSLERQKLDKRASEFAAAHLADLSDDPVFLMNVLSPRFANPSEDVITEPVLMAYSTAIMETSAADHAEILGWYAYNSRQFDAAEAWFRQSYGWEASADRLKGLALTYLRLKRKDDYAALKREFGQIYPGIWPEIAVAQPPKSHGAISVNAPAAGVKASYIRHFEARNYPACLREIDRLGGGGRKPAVVLIRGWCELGLKRFGDARLSFEAAMAGSGQVRADAIYGASLSLVGARLTDEAEALVTASPMEPARDRELRAEIYFQRARSAFDHQQFERVLHALDARAQLVSEPRDLTQMRAWAYYHLGRSEQAKAVFRQLNMVLRDAGSFAAIEQINSRERN